MAGVVTLAPLLDGAVNAGEATYMEILADCRVLCKGIATLVFSTSQVPAHWRYVS